MKKTALILLLSAKLFCVDITIIGYLKWADGLGRIPFSIVDCLRDTDLTWSSVETRKPDKAYDKIYSERTLGQSKDDIGVAILTDAVWYPNYDKYKLVPQQAKVKLAYSVFESDNLPAEWVDIFNNNFDAIFTTDKFEQNFYKQAGVTIPIFVLPNPFYIEPFFGVKRRESTEPFVFGFSSGFWERKNYKKLIQAFVEEFVGSKKVKLRLHNRFKFMPISRNLLAQYPRKITKNIEIINQELADKEYLDFLSSLNCYISVSKGEGFSIGPREAMAAGIPTIVTNNTAQATICESGCVLPIKSEIKESAYYEIFKQSIGHYYDCEVSDIRQALRQMYNNYNFYCEQAKLGRQWAARYKFENLKAKFQTLVKPKKIVLADEDKVEDGCIFTTNSSLIEKYKCIIN